MNPVVRSRVKNLPDAIRAHVKPGMFLNFASTPSRSNAAALELVRAFRGTNPAFVVGATGFHSLLHLLVLENLVQRAIACFFGDNYPVPRPNALYDACAKRGALEVWSLWSYVSSLRAGALGHDIAPVTSLRESDLGADLEKAGMYFEEHGRAFVRAMRPDITFVHGAVGDAQGRVLVAPPLSEGFWGAHAAKIGVIATVERIVEDATVGAHPGYLGLAPHRVLAVCEAPFGAHPQPLFVQGGFDVAGYVDDYEHYTLWRRISQDDAAYADFRSRVLDAPHGHRAYLDYVGRERLHTLERSGAEPRESDPPPASNDMRLAVARESAPHGARPNEVLIVLAARTIARRIRQRGLRAILAGIGHSFLAARMAKLLLEDEGIDVPVMVETGLYDLECGPRADEFLLSHRNISLSKRLTSVEDVLGTQTCGADNGVLGVIGAAQVDARGCVNSTRVGGKFLVGSGGANDIASNADEVVVLSRGAPGRLCDRVEHVTCPGHRVRSVVTDMAVLERSSPQDSWTARDIYPAYGGRPPAFAIEELRRACSWTFGTDDEVEYAPLISTAEMSLLHKLDPYGFHWSREKS